MIKALTLTAAALLLTCSACLPSATEPQSEQSSNPSSGAQRVPRKGTSETLDIASWNIEWFGDPAHGPGDEPLQQAQVYEVISGADMDLWGLTEISNARAFTAMTARLDGYSSVLASDAEVSGGAAHYSDFDDEEQKVGILYKHALLAVRDARIILGDYDYDFGGRPPLQVTLHAHGDHDQELTVIVVHAKCCTDTTSWTRRHNAALALKAYLDEHLATEKVWVIGDFNDDIAHSITADRASPYRELSLAIADYTFVSAELSSEKRPSTTRFSDTIDHHLVTNEAAATYVPGSAELYRVDAFLPAYASTTSDHFPLLSRYAWP